MELLNFCRHFTAKRRTYLGSNRYFRLALDKRQGGSKRFTEFKYYSNRERLERSFVPPFCWTLVESLQHSKLLLHICSVIASSRPPYCDKLSVYRSKNTKKFVFAEKFDDKIQCKVRKWHSCFGSKIVIVLAIKLYQILSKV